MKKYFYITSFGLLGFLVATLIHAAIEIYVLDLVFNEGVTVGSFWREHWTAIHAVFSTALWTVGAFLGLFAGDRWWDQYGSRPGAFGWRKQTPSPDVSTDDRAS